MRNEVTTKAGNIMTTFADIEDYLNEPNTCVIATVGRGNQPHASPVWYQYRDGVFTVVMGRGSLKHRDIEANPKVMITLDRREAGRGDRDFAVVMAEGVAELVPSVTREQLFELAFRYVGEEGTAALVQRYSADEMVAIRLRPRKVVAYKGLEKVLEHRG